LRKIPTLFAEFRETGVNEKLGFRNPEDLRRTYPSFFWNTVKPYIGDALDYLRVTQEGATSATAVQTPTANPIVAASARDPVTTHLD
jgi:hypothetical protein